MNLSPAQFDTMTLWVGAVCTIAIYTLLYRENPVYRVFEYLFLGLGAAYGLLRLFQDNLIDKWWRPVAMGEWWWMVPFLIGCLYFTLYFNKISWMARTLIGTLMGLVAGYTFVQVAREYFPQVRDSFRPLLPASVIPGGAPNWVEAGNNIVFFVTLVSVMTYFFFSFEHRNRAVTGTARLGRWLLMISFGTMFGSTITARVALAVSRIMYVLFDVVGQYTGWKL